MKITNSYPKVSIFSGLIICGYTQSELENMFEDRLKDFDKEKIKTWYNG